MTQPLSSGETFVIACALAAGIMLTRFFPFLLFGGGKGLPGPVRYLGFVLPSAAMAMILVYCVKDVSLAAFPHGLPELCAIVFTAVLHWHMRNVLASIACGTAAYMALVQVVF